MSQVKTALLLILLTALVVKVVWWVLEPALPWVLIGLGIVWIYGFILRGRSRW